MITITEMLKFKGISSIVHAWHVPRISVSVPRISDAALCEGMQLGLCDRSSAWIRTRELQAKDPEWEASGGFPSAIPASYCCFIRRRGSGKADDFNDLIWTGVKSIPDPCLLVQEFEREH